MAIVEHEIWQMFNNEIQWIHDHHRQLKTK